jgi:putative FmdB family regulatory protein
MPIYEYICESCNKRQELLISGKPPECTFCGSQKLERVYSSFSIKGSKKKTTTTCCGEATPCASPKSCCGR